MDGKNTHKSSFYACRQLSAVLWAGFGEEEQEKSVSVSVRRIRLDLLSLAWKEEGQGLYALCSHFYFFKN